MFCKRDKFVPTVAIFDVSSTSVCRYHDNLENENSQEEMEPVLMADRPMHCDYVDFRAQGVPAQFLRLSSTSLKIFCTLQIHHWRLAHRFHHCSSPPTFRLYGRGTRRNLGGNGRCKIHCPGRGRPSARFLELTRIGQNLKAIFACIRRELERNRAHSR